LIMDVNRFNQLPLMGIIRGLESAHIEPLLETVIKAGLETIEVTMNTPDAAGIIARACDISGGRITVGAGTVLSKTELNEALDAGASFIVLPNLEEEVVSVCAGKAIPVFPGALTPSEVFKAWKAGATMVKVFPAGIFGPRYIKELKGPFDDIRLMAVGGVTPENTSEYFSSGSDAVAFGGSVFRKEWLLEGDFEYIGKLVKRYVEAVRSVKS